MALCIVSNCCPTGCGVPVVILRARLTQTLFCYCDLCGCAWASPAEALFEAGLNQVVGIAQFAPAGVDLVSRNQLVQPVWPNAVIGELADSDWENSAEELNATIAAGGAPGPVADLANSCSLG